MDQQENNIDYAQALLKEFETGQAVPNDLKIDASNREEDPTTEENKDGAAEPAADPVAELPAIDPAKPADPITAPPVTQADPEIDEDKVLLEKLSKKLGRTITSLDELNTPAAPPVLTDEQKREAEENKRGEAVEFGKRNKIFNQSQYDDYIRYSNVDPVDAVQEKWINEAVKEDTNLSREDAESLFNQQFHLDADPDTIKFKNGMRQIKKIYEDEKREKFGNILDIVPQYEKHTEFVNRANAYTKELKTFISAGLPKKFEFPIGDQTYAYEIDYNDKEVQSHIQSLEKEYLTANFAKDFDPTSDKPFDAFRALMIKDFKDMLMNRMVAAVATNHAAHTNLENKHGRKGIINLNEQVKTGEADQKVVNMNDYAQKVLDDYTKERTGTK